MASSFLLGKWYMDAVSADGDLFIGYSARLRCPPVSVRYCSTLVQTGTRKPMERSSLLERREPEIDAGGGLRWTAPGLGVSAAWDALATPIRRTLWSSDEGDVVWSCCTPDATASVSIRGAMLSGRGYAEYLRLTIPPWRLPIRELRWGRFLSADQSVVWINWAGPVELHLVFRNSVELPGSRIHDGEIRLADGSRLVLEDGCVLRTGQLGSTVVRHVPGIERLQAARMLSAVETKWKSTARFYSGGSSDCRGWAIHEVVRWPA